MCSQSSVVSILGCETFHKTSHVSFIILEIVETPIKKSKCSSEKLVPVAKYLKTNKCSHKIKTKPYLYFIVCIKVYNTVYKHFLNV